MLGHRWLTIATVGVTACGMARASPWVEPPGGTYARLAIANEDVQGLSAFRTDIYIKRGLTKKWTGIAKVETLRFSEAPDFNSEGYRFALRRGLKTEGRVRVAAEGGVVGGEAIGGLLGCKGLGGELRLSTGGGWRTKNVDHFTFFDIVGRWHEDNCQRQRIEVGYGRTFDSRWQLINQVWLERGTNETRSDKAEIALTRKSAYADFTLAYRYEFSGLLDERAVVFAISKDF